MYYSPEGLFQLLFIGILLVAVFGPAIWLISKYQERNGLDPDTPKNSDKAVIYGVILTFVILLILASMTELFSS